MKNAQQTLTWSVTSVLVLGLWCILALAQQPQDGRLVIDHAPFTRPHPRGEPLIIEATITSPAGIRKAEVLCRVALGGDFTTFPMEPGGNNLYRMIVPDWMTAGIGLEYFIAATDERGQSASQGFVGFPLIVRFVSGQAPTQEERLKALQENLDSLRKGKETDGLPRSPQAPTNRAR